MKSSLRRAMIGSVTALGLVSNLLLISPAFAQTTYPNQPVKLVVPYPPGGATDILARMMAQKMQEAWNSPVIVENRPGAGGTIGANLVAKATPDGHTALFSIVALIQQITLMKLPYDPMVDFAPITRVAVSPSLLAVATALPVTTLADFLRLMKANPGKHNIGNYGPGTSAHLQAALLNMQAGTDLVYVPFQGAAPLITAMLGGHLTSAFLDAGSSRQQLDKFKVLGVTGPERLSWLPNVPTLKEQGLKSYEPMGWFGIFLPAATPKPVLDKFSAEAQRILSLPDVRQKIESMGLIPNGENMESFSKIMKSDAEIYARIIKDANITLN
jgi:tripartite-type tricarboxylate transporter receptor subunit TctC